MKKQYDIGNFTQKNLLYKQFVAWSRNGCSTAPLTDYINNPIYPEMIDKDEYFEVKSDERIYLDLKASSGYTNEAEKLERNDSKINLYILLKDATKKAKAKSLGSFLGRISVHISNKWNNSQT